MNETTYYANSRPSNYSTRVRLLAALFLALVIMLLAAGQAKGAMHQATLPGVDFKSPLDGSIVKGVRTVLVYAPDYAPTLVELGVDGGGWQPMQHQGGGLYAAKWNSGQFSNGKHTLTARFTLELGAPPIDAASIRIYVRNLDE